MSYIDIENNKNVLMLKVLLRNQSRKDLHMTVSRVRISPLNRLRMLVEERLRRFRIDRQYQAGFQKHFPRKEILDAQRQDIQSFKDQPLISILCPTFNTCDVFLKNCIESVSGQSYENWELCIVDDASEGSRVREIIQDFASRDKRIKCIFRKERGHISLALNDALELASGEFVGFLDHDDFLWPNALYEVVKVIHKNSEIRFIYSDEDKISKTGVHVDPFFKPNWSPHYLRSRNYIAHFALIERSLVCKAGGFRPGYEGAQDWDLFLQVTREIPARCIAHIPMILYSWRQSPQSTASQKPLRETKPYAYESQKKALEDDLKKRGLGGEVISCPGSDSWRIRYEILNEPLVSIIIPTKDQYSYLSKCLDSILTMTSYQNFELVVIDTGSSHRAVHGLYEMMKYKHPKTKILDFPGEFNFSSVCNLGARESMGEYLLFLNNDTEVMSRDWLEGLLEYAQMPEAGAVGGLLFYPNQTIQHAGIILGIESGSSKMRLAGHAYRRSRSRVGMRGMIHGIRNCSAVTAACLMVKKEKYWEVGGMDERFQIAFNDIDFNLKLMEAGYYNIYTSYVQLVHHESVSLGKPGAEKRDLDKFRLEGELLRTKWQSLLEKDPFYNENLSSEFEDYSLAP